MMLVTLHAALMALPPTGEVRAYRSASPLAVPPCGPPSACSHEYRPRYTHDFTDSCGASRRLDGDEHSVVACWVARFRPGRPRREAILLCADDSIADEGNKRRMQGVGGRGGNALVKLFH